MVWKFYILIGVLFLSIFSVGIILNLNQEEDMKDTKELYQGPVPEGYDEDYFRKTGITKPLPLEE